MTYLENHVNKQK